MGRAMMVEREFWHALFSLSGGPQKQRSPYVWLFFSFFESEDMKFGSLPSESSAKVLQTIQSPWYRLGTAAFD
jgi:hypothetical protein